MYSSPGDISGEGEVSPSPYAAEGQDDGTPPPGSLLRPAASTSVTPSGVSPTPLRAREAPAGASSSASPPGVSSTPPQRTAQAAVFGNRTLILNLPVSDRVSASADKILLVTAEVGYAEEFARVVGATHVDHVKIGCPEEDALFLRRTDVWDRVYGNLKARRYSSVISELSSVTFDSHHRGVQGADVWVAIALAERGVYRAQTQSSNASIGRCASSGPGKFDAVDRLRREPSGVGMRSLGSPSSRDGQFGRVPGYHRHVSLFVRQRQMFTSCREGGGTF